MWKNSIVRLHIMRNIVILFTLLLSITGCNVYTDLDHWMETEKETAEARYQKNYKMVDYSFSEIAYSDNFKDSTSLQQPFSPLKLKLSYFSEADRVRGVLESFDLSEMKYVGYLKHLSLAKGFINVGGQVYTVSNGTPIGKNYGRVVEVTPQKILIRENIENFEGLWISKDTEILMSKDKI
ncbi:MAG: hypothetical protein GKC53_00095 [Neisseriaceae bacterium]|nr:MAG: hypothetical protein GKC53_00095 [Neisseriaceae bacterium]